MQTNSSQRISLVAMFIAMAIAVHWMETFIPRPMPFLRFGFANIFTLCALYLFGGKEAFLVVIARVIIGSLLAGSLFTPTFFFSLSGGLAAGTIMLIMPKRYFSPVGVSVAGACGHMAAQLLAATLIIQHISLISLVPMFILVSVLTGMLNGYCTDLVLETFKNKYMETATLPGTAAINSENATD